MATAQEADKPAGPPPRARPLIAMKDRRGAAALRVVLAAALLTLGARLRPGALPPLASVPPAAPRGGDDNNDTIMIMMIMIMITIILIRMN